MSRSKAIVCLSLILLFIFPQLSNAQTNMEFSEPASNATVLKPVNHITMQFNTEVENLSTIQLLNGKGEEIKNSEIKIKDEKMEAEWSEPLPNDTYTVKWKIVGGDGYPIEGEYNFLVAVANQPEETPEPTTENGSESTIISNPSPTIEPLQSSDYTDISTTTSKQDNFAQGTFWIVCGIVIVAIIVFFTRTKKRK
ncbi:copper resistance CopC family protein [Paenibacillus sp. MMO-177]|uniref:copper resistance CopC family protein n=1 Tax=Paenibacillus sp. MMO-177 TaxID=3081289 RepID=UPI00301A65D2